MARLLFNLLSATLDADIDDNDTTITFTGPLKEFGSTNIATIAGPNTLTLKVGYELMHVTAYTSGASTATVTRGVEGSTATAHNEGDILRHVQTADDLPDLSTYAPLASPTFTGEPTAPSFQATGKTGATATPIRLAGGTASGAPASGAHLKGEIVFDDAGVGYYCTVAGTPGTWVSFGGGGGGGSVSDAAYGAGWDGDTTVAPSKNAVYDKVESLSSSYAPVRDFRYARYVAGSLTLNSTTWANLPTIGTFAIRAAVGDVIEAGLSMRWGGEAVSAFMDAVSQVAGSPVNSFATGGAALTSTTGDGARGWASSSGENIVSGGPVFLTIASGDLSAGVCTVRFRYRTGAATNRTIYSDSSAGVFFYARNVGPVAT